MNTKVVMTLTCIFFTIIHLVIYYTTNNEVKAQSSKVCAAAYSAATFVIISTM